MIEKHGLGLRWLHWLNVPLLAIMVWSGLMIYWAWEPYAIRVGGWTVISFFPTGFWKALGLRHRLAEGMALHFTFMWLFLLNGIAYLGYLAASGRWRQLAPHRASWLGALRVVRHELRAGARPPQQGLYNEAQRLAYFTVVLMGAGMILSGLAIYKPVQLGWLTWLLGGYEWARAEHFYLTLGLLAFVVVHLIQVVRAGWNNFRAMVAGFEMEQAHGA